MRWLAMVVLASCGGGGGQPDAAPDAFDPREVVASVSVTPNRDVDLLFVIDNSSSVLDVQTNLKNAFSAFVSVLAGSRGELPNLHIGFVTTDLGTRSAEDMTTAPTIGSGPGSCTGTGQAGNMQTATSIVGAFIVDVATATARMTNYTGTLEDAMRVLASPGAAGCGFEQPIEAAKVALDNNPFNAGFLRSAATLAIVFVTDEDDCSVAQTSFFGTDPALGILSSFRCTQFGVTCDQGGATPTEMADVGEKSGCHSNDTAGYLTNIDAYSTWFANLKANNEARLLVAALAGPPTPFSVARGGAPDGTTTAYLSPSCEWQGAVGLAVADPAVRVEQLVRHSAHNSFATVCAPDLRPQVTTLARRIRGMMGDACLVRSIAMPADCVVTETNSAGTRELPPCGAADCYQLVPDPVACDSFDHLRVDVMRTTPPPNDTVITVRCKI